jgi:hypothetical protein
MKPGAFKPSTFYFQGLKSGGFKPCVNLYSPTQGVVGLPQQVVALREQIVQVLQAAAAQLVPRAGAG